MNEALQDANDELKNAEISIRVQIAKEALEQNQPIPTPDKVTHRNISDFLRKPLIKNIQTNGLKIQQSSNYEPGFSILNVKIEELASLRFYESTQGWQLNLETNNETYQQQAYEILSQIIPHFHDFLKSSDNPDIGFIIKSIRQLIEKISPHFIKRSFSNNPPEI